MRTRCRRCGRRKLAARRPAAGYDPRVRRLLLGSIAIAACYDPTLRDNVPCAPDDECPGGQLCVDGLCTASSGHVPAADRDRDGVTDDRDNCPDLANADQFNEDGDKFGDACDSCPQIADNSATDGDVDLIGDVCDPNPGARDTVWLYNGFHAGLPSWARSSNWTAVNDKLRTNAPQNAPEDSEFLIPPFTTAGIPDNFSVTMTVVVEQMLGTTGDHSIGIEIYDMIADSGVDCNLDQTPAGANSLLFLQDDFDQLDAKPAYAWKTGDEYRLTLTRHGKAYTCNVVGPLGSQTATGNSEVVPRDGNAVDVWAYGMIAQYGSVQITGTP